MKVTSLQVLEFWQYMSKTYGLIAVKKQTSYLMKIIAWFLNLTKVIDKDNFLNHYVTVVRHKIYFPFTLGNFEEVSAEEQIGIITHECQHTLQKFESHCFNLKYLFSSRKRALFEAEAYSCNIAIHYWFTGKILSPKKIANLLKHYRCTKEDQKACEEFLMKTINPIKKGIPLTIPTLNALYWLNENLGHLKVRK